MRLAICQINEIAVYGSHGLGRAFRRGDVVNLDETFGSETIADALGAYVAHFTPVVDKTTPVHDDEAPATA